MREGERSRILMVDDDADFQTILRGWLSSRYDTVSVPHSDGLLEDLAQLEPDLLILDVMLPGPDGFKLCEKVRAEPRFENLPILFLTACTAQADFLKNLEVGGSAYLTKPVSRARLLGRIEELLTL